MIPFVLKQAGLRVVALFALASFGACRPDLCLEATRVKKNYKGECLSTVDYFGDRARIEISPKDECPWERLIDLGIFEGFRPGMTIGEARQLFGTPDVEADTGSRRVWKYRRQKGFVQIGHEDQGSAIVPFYYWWVLRAYPEDQSPRAFFPPEVVKILPTDDRNYETVILNQCRHPMAEVIIREGRIHLITWIKNPDSWHPDRQQAWRKLPPEANQEKGDILAPR